MSRNEMIDTVLSNLPKVISEYGDARVDLAFKGASDPNDWEEIESRYEAALDFGTLPRFSPS